MFPNRYSLRGNLSWTHYHILIEELNDDARKWYEQEALAQNRSVRTL